ncbi:unnamed protein product, partial [Polarella glacialis]
MSLWTGEEARAVAAALRALEEINEASRVPDQLERADAIFQAVLGSNGAAACDGWSWDSRLQAGAGIVADVWKIQPDLSPEELKRIAIRMRSASWSDWDARLCLPGVTTLGLVCATREFALNRPSRAADCSRAVMLCAQALSSCIDASQVEPSRAEVSTDSDEVEALRDEFLQDWRELGGWLLEPIHFYHEVQSPVLQSDRWWRGGSERPLGLAFGHPPASDAERQSLAPRLVGGAAAADACSGVWNPDPDHACHANSRDKSSEGVSPSENGMPATVVLGVGLMKAGTTLILQCLGAATQLSMGLDCNALAESRLAQRVAQKEVPLELVVDLCYNDLFRWELSKDPLATPVVRRLAAAWPAISQHGQKLRVYFVVRNPLDFVRSLLDHMGLKTKVKSANDQLFSWDVGQFPARFSAGKQQYLDVSLDNLTYSGYADALVQRWALVVDEYLACPRDFVLVRYEDFVQDPVSQTRLLLESLGLAERWSDGAEERVRRAAEVQYQTKGDRKQRDPEEVFGSAMLARFLAAVRSRAALLGYDLSETAASSE